ncbi:hypothetical protein STEG23_010139 [Scotinomys teguina]
MSRRQCKNTGNSTKNYMTLSEPMGSPPARPEHTNTEEAEEINPKNDLKMMEALKEEIKNSLKELEEKTNKQLEENKESQAKAIKQSIRVLAYGIVLIMFRVTLQYFDSILPSDLVRINRLCQRTQEHTDAITPQGPRSTRMPSHHKDPGAPRRHHTTRSQEHPDGFTAQATRWDPGAPDAIGLGGPRCNQTILDQENPEVPQTSLD